MRTFKKIENALKEAIDIKEKAKYVDAKKIASTLLKKVTKIDESHPDVYQSGYAQALFDTVVGLLYEAEAEDVIPVEVVAEYMKDYVVPPSHMNMFKDVQNAKKRLKKEWEKEIRSWKENE